MKQKQSRWSNQIPFNPPTDGLKYTGVNARARLSARVRRVKVTLPKVSILEEDDLEAHDRWRKT